MRPLRILKISQTFARFDPQGRTLHVRDVASRLARRGHLVSIVTAEYGTGSGRTETIDGVRVTFLPSLAEFGKTTVNPRVLPLSLATVGWHDVVHVYGLYDLLGPLAAAAARLRKVPYVLETMGMLEPKVTGIQKKRLYHAFLGNSLVAGAATLIATSDHEREELERAGIAPGRITLRRNGIETDVPRDAALGQRFRERNGLAEDASVVLFLGRLSPVKGLQMLIEAFSRIRIPTAHLVLVGPHEDPRYRELLVRMAGRLGVGDRVHMLGPAFGEDKSAAFLAADVFVLPSYSENFGVAAAEALAHGTPAVVTEESGIAEYVRGRAGLTVRPEVEPLRDGLDRALSDAEARRRWSSAALEVASELSWDEPVEQMERLYATVNGRRAG